MIMKILLKICIMLLIVLLGSGVYSYAGKALDTWNDIWKKMPEINGFLEEAYAPGFGSDDVKHRQYNMGEVRLQLESEYFFDGDNILSDWRTSVSARCDLVVDIWDGGRVLTDLRELNAFFTPIDNLDVIIGRQVLTWGTGDLVFLNDLFPKDYVSFFIGRDDEYLKLPNDALRTMYYNDIVNLDFVIIPFFEPNNLPDGNRLSFYDPFIGGIAGRNSEIDIADPSKSAKNFVYTGRAYRNFGSYEVAGYYYRGFDPSPKSFKNEAARQMYYERMDSYGGSVRGPFAWGIANAEVAYYYSPEDRDGNIRTIQNSQMRYLVGYEKDLGYDLRVGFQYYVEQMLDYSHYTGSLMPADRKYRPARHVITNRITKFFANQTVKFTVFTFFSPSDLDAYVRPSLTWKPRDAWALTVGADLLWGRHSWTEFGGVQKNKNIFMRLRYSF